MFFLAKYGQGERYQTTPWVTVVFAMNSHFMILLFALSVSCGVDETRGVLRKARGRCA